MSHTNNKELEEIEEYEMTNFERELAQTILGALEYRGFYDCGKYLDTTFIEHLRPLLHQELQKARAGQVKDVKDQVRRKKEHGNAMYEKGRRDARHDWLREEIEKLDAEQRKHNCSPDDGNGYDHGAWVALQIIIDRYQKELDQPK